MDTSENGKLRALKWSLYAITSVVLIEFLGGLLANSLAVISDAAHASLDSITTFWLLYATKLSLKPADADHTYGHGKIETLGGQIGGIALFGIAVFLFYNSINSLLAGSKLSSEFTSIAFMSVFYTLFVDIFRIRILRKVSSSSISARADLLHAMADFFSTVVAVIGLSLASLGFTFGDALSSLVLSVFLGYLSLRLIYKASLELSDIAPLREYQIVTSLLKGIEGVKDFKDLRMRKVGETYFIDVTILLSSTFDIEKAHNITSIVEEKIKKQIRGSTVTIHYEPTKEELPFNDKIAKVVLKDKNVRGVHKITYTSTNEGAFLTLHIEVDPTLTLSQAHGIAEKIEVDIKSLFPEIQETTVHIEGYPKKKEGEIVYKDEDKKKISQILASNHKIKGISAVKIYRSDNTKYVDITCSFSGVDSIECVHKEINLIENQIKGSIGDCIVTIHSEPF